VSWILVAQGHLRDLMLTVCQTLDIPHRVGSDDQPKMLLVPGDDAPLIRLLHDILTDYLGTHYEDFYVQAFIERLKDSKFSRALMSAYMLGGLQAAQPMLDEFFKPQDEQVKRR